jgi:hypothetical protein
MLLVAAGIHVMYTDIRVIHTYTGYRAFVRERDFQAQESIATSLTKVTTQIGQSPARWYCLPFVGLLLRKVRIGQGSDSLTLAERSIHRSR